jgi:hypothetical protein
MCLPVAALAQADVHSMWRVPGGTVPGTESPPRRPAGPAARAASNRGMSGLPDIGAGHDREDFIFREDFWLLFDANLT